MELGICTFVDLMPDPVTGKMSSAHQRMQNLMEEIELTGQVGLDVFAIGEHHRVVYPRIHSRCSIGRRGCEDQKNKTLQR